jgi:lipopolysaccharide exporter
MNVKGKIYRVRESEFLRNLVKMMSGTGFAHLIGIILIPVISRLYSPDEVGLYAAYISIFTICYSCVSLRYEYATLIPKSDFAANNITLLAAFLALFFSSVLFLTLFLFGSSLSLLLNIESLGKLIYLIPVSVFSYSLFMILSFSLNRVKYYGSIARGKIISSSGMAMGQVGMGWLQFQQTGLVLGKLIGDLMGTLLLLWSRRKVQASVFSGVSIRRMKLMAIRYRNFPLFNTPHALTTTFSNNIPVLLFNIFFTETIAGFYAMAVRALYSPVQVIAQAVYQVFSQRFAEKYANQDRILPFIHSNLIMLGGTGILPFLLLFIYSPVFFEWFLGSSWQITGHYVRILTPYVFLVFIVTPLNFIPLILNRQRKAFLIDLFSLVLRLTAIFIGIYHDSIWIALTLYSIVGVTICLYQLYWFYSIAKISESRH